MGADSLAEKAQIAQNHLADLPNWPKNLGYRWKKEPSGVRDWDQVSTLTASRIMILPKTPSTFQRAEYRKS